MEVNWTEFKKFVDARGCSIQYVEVGRNYWMKAFSGRFEVECFLPIEPTNEETSVFLASYQVLANKITVELPGAFASKSLANGKKLYKRECGIQADVTAGTNTILYPVPYNWVKIIGLEIIGGEKLDYVDMMILDSTTGTYSTIPNYQLNQFGFSVNVAADLYEETCTYDADLYLNMQIKIVYNSVSAKRIGINFNLNEVK